MKSKRSQLLRPLHSRGVTPVDLPVYPSDGQDSFHVKAVAPSGAILYVLSTDVETVVGFGEWWHAHRRADEWPDAVHLIEKLVSGELVVVEWLDQQGKYLRSESVLSANRSTVEREHRREKYRRILSWDAVVSDNAAQ